MYAVKFSILSASQAVNMQALSLSSYTFSAAWWLEVGVSRLQLNVGSRLPVSLSTGNHTFLRFRQFFNAFIF